MIQQKTLLCGMDQSLSIAVELQGVRVCVRVSVSVLFNRILHTDTHTHIRRRLVVMSQGVTLY